MKITKPFATRQDLSQKTAGFGTTGRAEIRLRMIAQLISSCLPTFRSGRSHNPGI